jgi:hypothetical protein
MSSVLQDHTARVRITRAARQLNRLFREIRPELLGALDSLPTDESQPVQALAGEIEKCPTGFGVVAATLLDASTLLNSEPAETPANFSTMDA